MLRTMACWLAALPLLAGDALAQVNLGTPPELEGIDIVQKLDAHLPLDAEFQDDQGRLVQLGSYFDGKKPVILTLNYYKCPMLCGLLLNGLLDALKGLSWTPGQEFTVVTLSFDPLENNTGLAKAKKQTYLLDYGRPEAARGWHFLTGRKEQIQRLTQAVGFPYRWNEQRGEWAHPSALIICTPDGRVARYLGGISFEPKTLRLSLVEAADGKVGSLWDQVFLTCFHYVSDVGKYTADVIAIMRLGGLVTMVALGLMVTVLWRRESRRRQAALKA